MMVQTGASDIVVAGGVESMSNVEYYTTQVRKGVKSGNLELHDRLSRGRAMSQPIQRFGVISGMIETAENCAKDSNITREQCDAYAVRSHLRATPARQNNLFDNELVPIAVPQHRGDPMMFFHDEAYRADASMETLGALRPIEAGEHSRGGRDSR